MAEILTAGQITITVIADGEVGPPGQNAVVGVLSNENHSVPANSAGTVSTGGLNGAITTMSIYVGTTDDSANWTVSAGTPTGLTGTLSGKTYTVATMTADTAWIDLNASRAGYPNVSKRFTLTKNKQGATGSSSTSYWLIVNSPTIKKDANGIYTPAEIIITSKSQVGTGTPANYSGRFIISEQAEGTTTWVDKYTSAANEATKTYTPSAGIQAIRVRNYLAGGTTTLLDEQTIPIVVDGNQGIQGPAGVSSYTHIAYATNATGTTGFSVSDPVGKTYIGMYVDSVATDSTDPSKYAWSLIKGADGSQGIAGPPGSDGLTPFLHIAYATNATGTAGFSTTDATGKTYIGTYTDYTAADSTDATKYTWQLTQGIKGDQGIPGVSSYTHIAYATNATGTTGFSVSDPVGKTYIGMYVDSVATDSTDPSKYAWSLIKGADGSQGIAGPPGSDGLTPFFHIAYATNSTGTAGFSTTDSVSKTYIGTYTDFEAPDSLDPTKYSWTLIKGDKGDTGSTGSPGQHATAYKLITSTAAIVKAISGSYTPSTVIVRGQSQTGTAAPVAYAGRFTIEDSADGVAFTVRYTSTSNEASKDYTPSAGIKALRVKLYQAGGTSMLLDEQIITVVSDGATGQPGLTGPTGPSGTSQYVHIRYSANSNGNPMTTTPQANTAYIGLANTTSSTAPTGYASYTWSLFKGPQGDTGGQGIPGPAGSNGQTTYTWVKYAEDEYGGNMSDTPSGKRYIGLAFNKTTPTETTSSSDYTWSPLYDNVQVGGRNLYLDSYLEEQVSYSTASTSTIIDESGSLTNHVKMTHNGVAGATNNFGFIHGVNDRNLVVNSGRRYVLSFLARGNVSNFTYSYFMRDSAEGGNSSFGTNLATLDPVAWTQVTIYKTGPFNTSTGYILIGSTDGGPGQWFEVKEVKLEEGTVKTDWTAAPEDIQEQFDGKAQTSDMDELAKIVSSVSADLNHKAGMGEFQALEAAFNARVAEDILDKEQLAADLATLEGRTALVETIAGDSKLVTEFIQTVITESEEGIYIANGTSSTGILIASDRISFMDNDVEVAYISNQTMQINHGIFVESAIISDFKFEKIPGTTILAITWVGG